MKMKVQILSRELVKPSTPTPPSLKNYNISLIDELSPTINIPFITYYPAPNNKSISTCNHLKDTLATTLNRFYVLAGRYVKDTHSVDCSDQGAEFVQAQVDIRLTDLIAQRATLKVELLNNLIPLPLGATGEITDPLLAIQVTIFDCGGLAIGACTSHRVADLSTICTFFDEWANVNANWGRSGTARPTSPSLDTASFFPWKNVTGLPLALSRSKENMNVHKIVTKIFCFKDKDVSGIKGGATRLQCVLGIIWKALVDANKVAKNGDLITDFVAIQSVNIRERTVPPLPKDSFGNLYTVSLSKYVSSEKEMEVQEFTNLLSNTVKSTMEDCGKILCGEEGQMKLVNPVAELNNFILSKPGLVNACFFTSWCRYPYYEADFGWGKPIWVSSVNLPVANLVVLIDDKEGQGIEAWVSLDEKDVKKFQENPIIKRFAT